jgi:Flp pilus assembly protein TadB
MLPEADERAHTMAIDGRTLVKRPDGESDAYESAWVKAVSHALIWVPLGLIVVLAYVSGTWIGGTVGGVVSVASAVLTGLGVWVWRRFFKRQRKA